MYRDNTGNLLVRQILERTVKVMGKHQENKDKELKNSPKITGRLLGKYWKSNLQVHLENTGKEPEQ